MADLRSNLDQLIKEYRTLEKLELFDSQSEATARSWVEKFLLVFGWHATNPSEVLQEVYLDENAQTNLEKISSHHKRPDYLICEGSKAFFFIDVKRIDDTIKDDQRFAFQIRSYGWSAGHQYGILTNFREISIYDCRFKPHKDDAPGKARLDHISIDQYLEKLEFLSAFLLKENVPDRATPLASDSAKATEGALPLDEDFAELLREWRLRIAKDLLRAIPHSSIDSISGLTQMLVDRIIFLRVAEGFTIEKPGTLRRTISGDNPWQSLLKHFDEHCSNRYGGALFHRKLDEFSSCSAPLLREFVDELYFPNPYRFDVISPHILGNIYERYLGRRLVLENNSVNDQFKPEYQKSKGAIYTPKYIVDEICNITLGPLMDQRDIAKNLRLKVLDPSCGSGSFLMGTLDFFQHFLTSKFASQSNGRESWFWMEPRKGTFALKSDAKRKIVNSSIFGLDIDSNATEIAKLSLSLAVLSDCSHEPDLTRQLQGSSPRVLDGIGSNVKTGNSLVDSNIFEHNKKLASDLNALKKLKPFDWEKTNPFATVLSHGGGFDAIVGNPPYIEIKHYKNSMPEMHEYLTNGGRYKTCGLGKVDISMPFIERSFDLLNSKGRLGFIVQNRFFTADYGGRARQLLSSLKAVEQIIDFGSMKIFPKRTTYTCILILSKTRCEMFKYRKLETTADLKRFFYDEIEPRTILKLCSHNLERSPWFFADEDSTSFREFLLRKFGSIKDHESMSINVGLQVLYKKIYLIKGRIENDLVSFVSQSGTKVSIEKDSTRPIVDNRGFFPFKRFREDHFAIFPYEMNGSPEQTISHEEQRIRPLLFDEFSKRFPLCSKYLSDSKSAILDKVETRDDDEWHLYKYEKNLVSQQNIKVLIPSTSKDVVASLDENGTFYQDNVRVSGLQIKGASLAHYKLVCCVLNSKVFDLLAKMTAGSLDNGYIQLNRQFLETVPFPLKRVMKAPPAILTHASKVFDALASALNSLSTETDPETMAALKIQIALFENNLNELANCVYGLDHEECATLKKNSRREPLSNYLLIDSDEDFEETD